MRLALVGLAAVAALVVLVKARKAARLAERNTRRHEPVRRAKSAARQKPGQAKQPKVAKPKSLRP